MWFFARPALCHPAVSHRITRTETQGLANVSVHFFGTTDKNLTKPYIVVGKGEISIQRQRMFTFRNALYRSLGHYVDKTQQHMAKRMVWCRGQRLGQFFFGRSERRYRSFTKELAPPIASATADKTIASTLSGSAMSALSKNTRARATLSGVQPLLSQAKP